MVTRHNDMWIRNIKYLIRDFKPMYKNMSKSNYRFSPVEIHPVTKIR